MAENQTPEQIAKAIADAANLKKQKASRKTIRTNTTTAITHLQKLIKATVITSDDIEDQLAILELKEKALEKLNETIYTLLDGCDETELATEFDSVEKYKTEIALTKSQVARTLKKAGVVLDKDDQSSTTSSSCSGGASASQQDWISILKATQEAKLAPLTIEKFYGEATEWTGFWSNFECVVDSKINMQKVQKFSYLKSYLGGKALRVISGMKPSDESYDEAVKMLKNRFGRDELVSHSHMKVLFALKPVESSKDLVGLENLYNVAETHVRSLKSIGIHKKEKGLYLCPKLLSCIPEDIRLEFTKECGVAAEWDVDSILTFLGNQVENRQTSQLLGSMYGEPTKITTSNEQNKPKFNKFDNKFQKYENRPNKASASVLTSQFQSTSLQNRGPYCIFCKEQTHHTSNCVKLSLDEKRKFIREDERCEICMRFGHSTKECTSRFRTCRICGSQKHNAALCEKNHANKKNSEKREGEKLVVNSNSVTCERAVLLQTAQAVAENPVTRAGTRVRCLLDNGSQASFVNEKISRELNLPIIGECEVQIRNFGNETPTEAIRKIVKLTLGNANGGGEKIEIAAVEVPYICEGEVTEDSATMRKIERQLTKKGYQLADETAGQTPENIKIGVLIGGDVYWEFCKEKIERFTKRLVAVETTLGWSIQGPVKLGNNAVGCYTINVLKVSLTEKHVSKVVESFWTLEGMGITEKTSDPTKTEILENFQEETKFENGRYAVKFPWIRKKETLPDNLAVATKRMEGLARRFQKEPQLYAEYKEIIEEQIKQGVAEAVPDLENKKAGTYYLPHQPVRREESLTTKLRVVFDASSHAHEAPSLNDCLSSGPNLNPDMLQLLLRFRVKKIAIVADITKAFLQVSLNSEDRDSVRFLWIREENGKINLKDFKIMRMARVPFGVTSSPYLLAATIKTHLKKYEEAEPKAYEVLNESLYVDDLVGGENDDESAYEISRSASKILAEANMDLRKWQTNSDNLRKRWNIETEDPNSTIKFNGESEPKIQKILGYVWDPKFDTVSVDLEKVIKLASENKITKRKVLSTVAQIFDPIGILAPYTIRAKIIFQGLWELKLKWDEELPEILRKTYAQWCEEMKYLREIKIPRCYFVEKENIKIKKREIHCFTDSSKRAYAAIVYLRYVTSDDKIHVSFVTSKSRVAPLKDEELPIPKLELMGCLLGARLVNNVKKIFKNEEDFTIKMWSDSEACLAWIRSPAKNWKPFVQNRSAEIQKLVDPKNWSHCPGKQNPADLPTRGIRGSDLKENTVWWRGPAWLLENEGQWPKERRKDEAIEGVEKERRKVVMTIEVKEKKGIQEIIDLNRHNSLNKILRIIAYIYRFIERKKITGPITADELSRAEIKLVKDIQSSAYAEEIKALREKKPLPKTSKILTLKPRLNDQGLLCLGGRIDEAEFSYATKHPIIINKNERVAHLLMIRSHEQVEHEGIQATVTQAREKYWTIAGRQLAKNIVTGCFKCKKFNAKPCDTDMGLLPKDRITEAPPFSVVGIDFGGPLMVKIGDKIEKSYICLFTCSVTRAVHLELVPSQSTYEFMMALRRMISRRGIPTTIYSDNAKSFKKAKSDLNQMWDNLNSDAVKQFFGKKGINWKFIVERAPWWGGHYERLIKSTKVILRKILGKASLTYQEVETILQETEAVINSRPITYVFNNANEPEPLSPAHLLIGKRITCLPSQNAKPIQNPNTQTEFAKRLRHRSVIQEKLCKRWKLEYLLELRNAHHVKLAKKDSEIKVGDVMIVHEDHIPKHMWKLGLVTEVMVGRDGKIRSCMIKLGSGTTIRRPIQLLYALELDQM